MINNIKIFNSKRDESSEFLHKNLRGYHKTHASYLKYHSVKHITNKN